MFFEEKKLFIYYYSLKEKEEEKTGQTFCELKNLLIKIQKFKRKRIKRNKRKKQTKKLLPTTDPTSTTETVVPISEDLLPREPCLQALAALRHAKWFQVCFCFFLFWIKQIFQLRQKETKKIIRSILELTNKKC